MSPDINLGQKEMAHKLGSSPEILVLGVEWYSHVYERLQLHVNPSHYFEPGNYTDIPAYKAWESNIPINNEFNFCLARLRVCNKHTIRNPQTTMGLAEGNPFASILPKKIYAGCMHIVSMDDGEDEQDFWGTIPGTWFQVPYYIFVQEHFRKCSPC
ncbi:hypothetical protein VP01_1934g2 [Puccinia sorghi]|uniref:Uncharacterized protein n=1 Tax=Puccinia sorghi TaxID=27349 RepID=A0A0L6VE85_9BASI|nr:hypothetical protein VP01_1934g2 [Puccinia sorghi]